MFMSTIFAPSVEGSMRNAKLDLMLSFCIERKGIMLDNVPSTLSIKTRIVVRIRILLGIKVVVKLASYILFRQS